MYTAIMAVCAAMGVALFGASLYFERGTAVRRKMRAVPLTTIAEAKEGQRVRLQGIPTGSPLQAPLSGRPCVFFHLLVDELFIGQKVNYWKRRTEEEGWVDFVLVDATGQLLVKTEGAVSGALFHSARTGAFVVDPSLERAFLERQAAKGVRIPSRLHRDIRMTEAILQVGQTIAVVGTVKDGRLVSVPGKPLWATDDIDFV